MKDFSFKGQAGPLWRCPPSSENLAAFDTQLPSSHGNEWRSFSVRIFAQPNFENVTGIGLHTLFEEMSLSHSVPWKVFLTLKSYAKSLRNTSRLNISVILRTLIKLEIYPTLIFALGSFSMVILNYPFSKVLSPQPLLHRMGSRKKTDELAEHDLILYD